MNSYYFLHAKSLCNIEYDIYKSGLIALNALVPEMREDEKRLKSNVVYQNPLYVQLLKDYAETSAIIQFIEQSTTDENNIDTDAVFQSMYPDRGVGFLGINFNKILGIAPQRQVVNFSSLRICRKYHYDNLIKYGNDKIISSSLMCRFPKFVFSAKAQEDLLWWKHNRIEIVDSVLALLDDILINPFTGGIGKTEVLSRTKITIASKRITQEDRLTYTFGEITKVIRCKGHYK